MRRRASMDILYADKRILVAIKPSGVLSTDEEGGMPSLLRSYLGDEKACVRTVHRLDAAVQGVMVFARTSKALTRLNAMFQSHEQIRKTYWAIVSTDNGNRIMDKGEVRLENYLWRNEKQNKSFVVKPGTKDAKRAVLTYKAIAQSDRYTLLEINLETGRHHQIRCQLAAIGLPIKGDLKYGAKRSNPDGGISLHARQIAFIHPVSKQEVIITAPVPEDKLWKALEEQI